MSMIFSNIKSALKLSNINITLKNYIFIMKIAFFSAKKFFLILIGVSIVNMSIPPITLYLGKKILDILVSPENEKSDITIIITLIVGVGLLTSIIGSIYRAINSFINQLISNHITNIILKKAIILDLKYFDTPTYYEQQKSIERALSGNWETLAISSIHYVNALISLIIMIGILSNLNIWLVPIIFVGVLPTIFVGIYVRNKEFYFYTHQIPEMRKIDYIKFVLTNPQFAKEIKLFQSGSYFMEKYNKAFGDMYKERKKLQIFLLIREMGASILSAITMGGCQLYIALKAFSKIITIGDYSMFFGAAENIAKNLNMAISIVSTSYEQMLLADVLGDYINLKSDIELGEGININSNGASPTIEFKNVSFKYTDASNYVLKGLDFKISPGEKVALVGLNGAGKTTIIKLMTRLYDVTDGAVFVNDKDIKVYKPEEIYNLYSVVFQDYAKYGLSIKENIAIGNLSEIENRDKYEMAAKEVGLTNIIDKLPNKYESYITKLYDMSGLSDLSVGEWQKLSIARAFFRPASLYILDEPTASLDPKIEHEVFEQFVKLSKGKTSILISHRLSSVCMVDKIFFLKGGKIEESGSHDELIKLGGEYAKLFNLQASKYIQNNNTLKNEHLNH